MNTGKTKVMFGWTRSQRAEGGERNGPVVYGPTANAFSRKTAADSMFRLLKCCKEPAISSFHCLFYRHNYRNHYLQV